MLFRPIRVVFAILTLTAPLAAQDSSRVAAPPPTDSIVYTPLTTRDLIDGFIAPRRVIRSVALAGYDQWRGHPLAYAQTWRGFSDRLGGRYGQVAVSHVLRFAGSRVFHERTFHYQLCGCEGKEKRLEFAALAPFRVVSASGVHYSILNPTTELLGGIASTGFRSSGFRAIDGVRNGVTGIAIESLTDVAREFWPFHWRPPFF